jgi:hypothetical protein
MPNSGRTDFKSAMLPTDPFRSADRVIDTVLEIEMLTRHMITYAFNRL